jgi:GxxExxY protein
MEQQTELLLADEVYAIVGAAFEVHRELGAGFAEAVYQEALEREFRQCGIPARSQVELPVAYKGELLDKKFICDFVCFEKIVVELKALEHLSGKEEAQLLNYLKASSMPVGVLLNFGTHPKLSWKRLAKTR